MGKNKNNFSKEKPDKEFLPGNQSQHQQDIKYVAYVDMMWWKWHFTFVIFSLKTQNLSLTLRKTSETNFN